MIRLKHLKVLIIGLGQIGGSMGLDLINRKIVREVIGYDINSHTARMAKNISAVNSISLNLTHSVPTADLVILATPIRQTIKILPLILPAVKSNACIIDTAGIKSEILNTVNSCSPSVNYISCHPIAGTEGQGIQAAQPNLFADSFFAMTEKNKTSQEWIEAIKLLIKKLGAEPFGIKAETHDRNISLTSHLPYLMAISLTNLIGHQSLNAKNLKKMIGGSYKSATRVAQSSPELSLDMFMSNRESVITAIDRFSYELMKIKRLINSGDEKELKKIISAANKRATKFHT
ncbi:MAG: prephenate dehydrogenase [candidate division Zixibacteria bacterium]